MVLRFEEFIVDTVPQSVMGFTSGATVMELVVISFMLAITDSTLDDPVDSSIYFLSTL